MNMAYEPEITTTDILDALGELGDKVDRLTEAVAEVGRGIAAGIEGLGRSMAALDACVGKVDARVKGLRTDAAGQAGTRDGASG